MIFRNHRWLAKLYAKLFGYFWLPCHICGNYFGGHEWPEDHTMYINPGYGVGFCYRATCKRIADRSNRTMFEMNWYIDGGTFSSDKEKARPQATPSAE